MFMMILLSCFYFHDFNVIFSHGNAKTASIMEAVLIYQLKKIRLLFSLRNLNSCKHPFIFLQLQFYSF